MDAYDLINMLNQVQGLADSLDGTGVVGVKALTNGQYTTRYTLKLELSKFLLYIANGKTILCESITMSVIRKSSMSTTRKTVRTRLPLYLRTL